MKHSFAIIALMDDSSVSEPFVSGSGTELELAG